MTDKNKPTSRRTIVFAAAALTSAPLFALAGAAQAAGGVTQANAKYRPSPNGAAQCGKCNYFLPGPDATKPGQCKVVAGAISPNGWCQLFAPKHG
jgi:hypothetical protein